MIVDDCDGNRTRGDCVEEAQPLKRRYAQWVTMNHDYDEECVC